MKKVYFLLSFLPLCWLAAFAQQETCADRWEYVGIAIEEPGYTIWGTSPVMGDDGKVHLYVARWPCDPPEVFHQWLNLYRKDGSPQRTGS